MGREPRKHVRRKFTQEDRKEIHAAFADYIAKHGHPTIAGFVSSNEVALAKGVLKSHIYDWLDFDDLRERCHAKQEAYLLDRGLNGQSTAMAIFLLKQQNIGYRDKFEQDITTGGERITFTNAVPRPELKGKKKQT